MTLLELARKLRTLLELAAQSLQPADALEGVELFPTWKTDTAYDVGYKVRHGGILYACLQAHTSQAGWEPGVAPSLWAKVLIPDPDVIPDWEQPDSTNPYSKGDKVRHNGKIWVSTIDGNVWEPGAPGVYVWTEVTE
ncbi:MAG: alpha-amylase [Oscillospiraceae bacterium]|nr:alpha-amylase [Oscillospiraceae bacterium]MBR4193737.1 alpha-amylase [Oscillospiraceae bacterium]